MMGPKKGTIPNLADLCAISPQQPVGSHLSGVPGQLVDAAPPDILFGPRKTKTSPYDPLLLQLQKAGAGKFLRFEDLRARPSLTARAKKLNIKILFGEQGSTLWVTLAKAELSHNSHVEELPAPKARPLPEIVLDGIVLGQKDTPGLIVSFARRHGAPDVTLNAIDRVIAELARAGKIKLKPVRRGDPDPSERWMAT